MEEFNFIKHIGSTGLIVLVSVTGGIAKYAQEYLETKTFSFGFLVANIFVSGFAGLMFGYFGGNLGVSQNMQFVFGGIGGFFGKTSLDWLYKRLTR